MEREEFDNERRLAVTRLKVLFDTNVRGLSPELDPGEHEGAEGHWLQTQFGIPPDNANAPDILGFELKSNTTSKTTFGDWTADCYLFFSHKRCEGSQSTAQSCSKCRFALIGRDDFLSIFGAPNPKKRGRFSWSGRVFPKVGSVNSFGQEMIVLKDRSVEIRYHFSADSTPNRRSRVPVDLQIDNVLLARWEANSLRLKVESKFNNFGWIKCVREPGRNGRYVGIEIGRPLTFELWIRFVRSGDIFLDSGMYQGNVRPYQNWRAMNSLWRDLVDEYYGERVG